MQFGLNFMQQETTSSVLIYGVVLCRYYFTKAAIKKQSVENVNDMRVALCRKNWDIVDVN